MQNSSIPFEDIRIDDRLFRVTKITFDKNIQKPKVEKSKKKEKNESTSWKNAYADNNDEGGNSGWINVEEENTQNVMDIKNERQYNDEISCEVANICKINKDKEICGVSGENTDYTHFFCLPLNFKDFQSQVKVFKTEIERKYDDIFNEYYTDFDKLHLTLLMLRLDTSEKNKTIQSIKSRLMTEIQNITKGKSINIELGELTLLNPSKDYKQGILAIKIKENHGLGLMRKQVDLLVRMMLEQKLVQENELSHIKLNNITKKYELQEPHITLLRIPEKSKLRNNKFNLKNVLDDFRKFNWNTITVDSIFLAVRDKLSVNNFYAVDMDLKFR